MNLPEKMPAEVNAALKRYAERHTREDEPLTHLTMLQLVQWDALNGCYYFIRNGMYHGVELDGHIHT